MKIYLSGPITGKPNDNAPAFRRATATLRAYTEHEIVSPHELDEQEGIGLDDLGPELWGACLGRDVEVIANGNFSAIYLLRDWQYSKGSRVEVVLGLMLGLMLFDYETGLQIPASEAMKVISYTILEGK